MKRDHYKFKMFVTVILLLFTLTLLVDFSDGGRETRWAKDSTTTLRPRAPPKKMRTKKPKPVITNNDMKCDYKKLKQNNVSDYTCAILYRKVPLKDIVPVTISGKHFWQCNDSNVTFVAFYGSTIKRIPRVVFHKFKNLQRLDVQISKLEVLDKDDLRGAWSLKELWAKSNSLEILHADSFHGAPNLQLISMSSNIIYSVDENTFKNVKKLEKLFLAKNYIITLQRDLFVNLPKLKLINLHSNKIQVLPAGLFRNNLQLEDISLNNNKIEVIGENLFTHLVWLKHVNLTYNICIRHIFGNNGNNGKNEFMNVSLLHQAIYKCTEADRMEVKIEELTKELYQLRRIIENRN